MSMRLSSRMTGSLDSPESSSISFARPYWNTSLKCWTTARVRCIAVYLHTLAAWSDWRLLRIRWFSIAC